MAVFPATRENKFKEAGADDRPWSDLPADILGLILNGLPSLRDHTRFGVVCKPWRSASRRHPLPPQLPWLAALSGSSATHGFLSLSDGAVYTVGLPPEARGAHCCGSWENWLVASHPDHGSFLLNPFTGAKIPLPNQTTILLESKIPGEPSFVPGRQLHDDWHRIPAFIRRATMSSPPTSDRCLLAALCSNSYLLVCRPRGSTCTVLFDGAYALEDIIFYNGQLYGINGHEDVLIFELGDEQVTSVSRCGIPQREDLQEDVDIFGRNKMVYLVESRGKLLMVVRFWERRDSDNLVSYCTVCFRVFELEWSPLRWVEVKSLDGHILFLGTGCPKSVPAAEYAGFKGDCIYFTDDHFHFLSGKAYSRLDFGVFFMEDGIIKPLCPKEFHSSSSPSAWISHPNEW